MTPRPTALVVNVDGIPAALKTEPRWVMWRYVWKAKENKSGRWSKILCLPDGTFAKSNDPATWTTFDNAAAAYRRGGFDGIGFCLGNGWCGIDLDRCRAMAFPLHNRLPDCYLEVSPSGNGFKAIGRAARTGGEINYAVNPPAHTPWHGARFFAITGHEAKGDPTVDLTMVIDELFPTRRTSIAPDDLPDYIKVGDTRGTENIETLTDEQVVRRIFVSPRGDKFIKLVRGDMSDYGNDHSRADQALVSILAYWCMGDIEQIDRIFRQTALMRDKWDVRSYRRATLEKAVRA